MDSLDQIKTILDNIVQTSTSTSVNNNIYNKQVLALHSKTYADAMTGQEKDLYTQQSVKIKPIHVPFTYSTMIDNVNHSRSVIGLPPVSVPIRVSAAVASSKENTKDQFVTPITPSVVNERMSLYSCTQELTYTN